MRSIYTDLALEAAEAISGKAADSIEGLSIEVEEVEDATVTTVQILDERGAAAMGKPVGTYITIESAAIKSNDVEAHEAIMGILCDKIASLRDGLGVGIADTVLVIGLGNQNVTPDALGPMVVAKTLVTRHIMADLPQELAGGLRPLAAIAPGVMGMTGIETAEAVKGLVEHVKPALVVAIDALAARSIGRINQTIQLTDTGISPGAGVGNRRMALNADTLGIPVLAIGVPTVVGWYDDSSKWYYAKKILKKFEKKACILMLHGV